PSYLPLRISRCVFHPSPFPLLLSHFIFPTSYFPLQISHFAFPTSYFTLRISHFVFPTSYFPLHISHFIFPTSYFPFRISDFVFQYFNLFNNKLTCHQSIMPWEGTHKSVGAGSRCIKFNGVTLATTKHFCVGNKFILHICRNIIRICSNGRGLAYGGNIGI